MRLIVLRIDLANRPKSLNHLVIAMSEIEHDAGIGIHRDRHRVKFLGFSDFLQSFIEPPQSDEMQTVPKVRLGVARLQLERALELPLGIATVEVVKRAD